MKKVILLFAIVTVGLLSPKASAQTIVDNAFVDGLFVEQATGRNKPMPMPTVREADVMWQKRIWREIDFRQKINQRFYYPVTPHQNWKNFITIILDGLKEGRIQAYEISETDELTTPISYKNIMDGLTGSHTEVFLDENGYEVTKTISDDFYPTSVQRLRIMEEWYFDKQRSQLMVRILALCPVMNVEKDDGEGGVRVGTKPMFWIPFDSAREVLSESYYFNRNNGAMKLTYDEVFWKRMFDSYIYKEENVYDRSIQDYAQGINAMLESERIKQSIIDFEQYLWDY